VIDIVMRRDKGEVDEKMKDDLMDGCEILLSKGVEKKLGQQKNLFYIII